MTKEQFEQLSIGDQVREIATGEILTVDSLDVSVTVVGEIVYFKMLIDGGRAYFPYFLYELELIEPNRTHLCRCARMDVVNYGCKCGGI